jgi:hypothetical protein
MTSQPEKDCGGQDGQGMATRARSQQPVIPHLFNLPEIPKVLRTKPDTRVACDPWETRPYGEAKAGRVPIVIDAHRRGQYLVSPAKSHDKGNKKIVDLPGKRSHVKSSTSSSSSNSKLTSLEKERGQESKTPSSLEKERGKDIVQPASLEKERVQDNNQSTSLEKERGKEKNQSFSLGKERDKITNENDREILSTLLKKIYLA